MRIKTKETVEKIMAKYRWDNLEDWKQEGTGSNKIFVHSVYQTDRLNIRQTLGAEGQGISMETPDYTLYVSTGQHSDPFTKKELTPYYSLSIATTQGEKKVYQDMIDEKGFKDIRGNRDILFHFVENVPERYFEIAVDEKATHISTHWTRLPREIGKKNKRLTKERT